jgi:molybdopterin-guanine dinucleotide biosynthesis protein
MKNPIINCRNTTMIIISLIGLKKCGKTTTAEALIREFGLRGYKVGGVKFMPHSSFTIDQQGKDTWRHREAGADFVISLSREEIAYIEKRREKRHGPEIGGEGDGAVAPSSHPTLDDVLRLVPEDTDVLICEGLTEDDQRIVRVVLAKTPDLLRETFEVRGIEASARGWSIEDGTKVVGDRARIIALSGIMANEIKRHPDFPELPVFNCSTVEGTVGLVDLIVREFT